MHINQGLAQPTATALAETDRRQSCSDSRQPDYELSELAGEFLGYMRQYRQASPLTVEAYRRDLRRFEQFLRSSRLPMDVRDIDARYLQAFAVSMMA